MDIKEAKGKGLLLTNAFLRTGKFVEHYEWLRRAAGERHVTLDILDNAQKLIEISEIPEWLRQYDFIIDWDKDISYAKTLSLFADKEKIPFFNSIDAIAACDDKYETYLRLAEWNIEHPAERLEILPTICAPMTYQNVGYTQMDFLDTVEEAFGYPMVVKECFGSFGMQVYMAHDRKQLEELTKRLGGTAFLYQKYHKCSSGRDVRLQVVGDKVVAAMERYSENGDFRANITNGGSMKIYEPSEQEKRTAVQAAHILGLTFGGVDLLFNETGDMAQIVCEINSNAHFKNIYTCTGVNVADKIMDHIFSVIY